MRQMIEQADDGGWTVNEPRISERLNRVEQAADRLEISRAHTYELIRTGDLPSVKLGRSRRIRESDLMAFIARLSDDDRER